MQEPLNETVSVFLNIYHVHGKNTTNHEQMKSLKGREEKRREKKSILNLTLAKSVSSLCVSFVARRTLSHFGEQLELSLDLSSAAHQENITHRGNGLMFPYANGDGQMTTPSMLFSVHYNVPKLKEDFCSCVFYLSIFFPSG